MKKFSKICTFVLCCTTIFLLVFQFGCDKYGEAKYCISEDESYYYVVGAKDKNNSKIEICSEIDGLPVKYIDDYAFRNCDNLIDVRIQEGVKSIGFGAFQGCTGLKNINVPSSLETIDVKAFSGCSSLETIALDESNVTEIKESAFENCTALNSVALPQSLTKISYGMFCGCEKLSTVTFPLVDFSIEEKAFWLCGFEKIVIGKNVVEIKSSAFSRNYNLTEFIVDDENEYYKAIDGNLYSKDGKTFMFYAMGKSKSPNGAESFTIGSDVNKILPYAFYDEDGRIVLKQVYLDGALGWKLNGDNAQALVNNSFQMAGNLRYTYADGEWTR